MAKLLQPSDVGIHASVANSWDAKLTRELRVLVPIHVDALVVRTETAGWADCTMRAPNPDETARSVDLLPAPFADRAQPRPRGVHLHWAMPDSLANVRAAGSTLATPNLPDRWLVARIGPERSGSRAVTAWMLDARTATQTPLDAWKPDDPSGKPLTVLGIGDAGWAAYYDNVINRFAFHDPLAGVERGQLAYLVCGWYADATDDPLAVELRSLAAFRAHLAGLGWDLPEDDYVRAQQAASERIGRIASSGLATPHAVRDEAGRVAYAKQTVPLGAAGEPLLAKYGIVETHWPRACLFHGAVLGLSWPTRTDDSPEVGGPPPANEVQVAFGATPADALGALIARKTGTVSQAQWLTAFTLGALKELQQPDGAVRIEDALHEAAFASRSDGTEHVVRPPSPAAAATAPRPADKSSAASKLQKDALSPKAAYAKDVAAMASESRLSAAVESGRFAAVSSKEIWQAKPGRFHEVHVAPVGRAQRTELPTEIDLPKPRLYLPAEPVIAIEGARRAWKHGGDGRYTPNNRLMCRLSSTGVSAIALRVGTSADRITIRGVELLQRPLAHGGLPSECEELLEELGLLDVGSAPVIGALSARAAPGNVTASALQRTAATEQTVVWALRSPDVDSQAILSHSALSGRLPSPIAVRPPQRPWVPLHLDWEIEYIPAPPADWSLGEIEFEPPQLPETTAERFSGRCLLSAGIVSALARSLTTYLQDEQIAGGSKLGQRGAADALSDLATQLADLDALAGPLEHFHLGLRRKLAPDEPTTAAAPDGFVAVRSGFLRIRRLRLCDAFGQALYLAGSGPGADAVADTARIAVGTGIDLAQHPGILALPPRFTAPTKLSLRFRNADALSEEASAEHTPVCGWILPDHIDGALEFFDKDGAAIGQLRHDLDRGVSWEHAPGLLTPLGAAPREVIPHRELAAMADALLAQSRADAGNGRTQALLELLRVIDSTRWTVDPFAHTGEEHLALLIGHPIAVVCATLKLEVREPVNGSDVPITRVPVRLGALTHWQDGLFGYFVAGDYTRFRCAASAAALARPGTADGFLGPIGAVPTYAAHFADDVPSGGATPVVHPYLDASGVMWIVPGVEYELLLLLEPHCRVHATTGLLPRKHLALPREWAAPALARIAPTFRFGPVLRDPQQIRMPIPSDIGAAWTWTHRADVDRWVEEEVVHAGHEALLSQDPAIANEGWLKMTPLEPAADGGGKPGGGA